MSRFLHVGCGPATQDQTTPGFAGADWQEVRFDIDPSVKPDIVGTMTDMSGVPDASMDGLFSSHSLEHLYPFETLPALAEFLRVLRPAGFAVITCPDIQSVAAVVAEGKLLETLYDSAAGPISALDVLYGWRPALARGELHMAHRSGFTADVLAAVLKHAGFGTVVIRRRPAYFDLWALAAKSPLDRAQAEALTRAHFPPA